MQNQRRLIGRVTPLPVPPPDKKLGKERCGAICRDGSNCQNFAKANGRCRMHGGNARKGVKPPKRVTALGMPKSVKSGIYAATGLHPHEWDDYETVVQSVGSLDEEIAMAKVKLKRCYKAQQAWEAVRGELAGIKDPKEYIDRVVELGIMDFDEIQEKHASMPFLVGSDNDVGGKWVDVKDSVEQKLIRRKTDFVREIRDFSKLVNLLTNTRVTLLESQAGKGDDYLRDMAQALRDFNEEVADTLPNQYQWGAGNYNDGVEQ